MARTRKDEPKPAAHDEAPEPSKLWSLFMVVATLLAAGVARKGMKTFWRAATGKEPPTNPADPDLGLREAAIWALASGALMAFARMIAMRRAGRYYARSTGHPPPGAGHA